MPWARSWTWTWNPCSGLTFSPKNLRSVVYNLLSNAMKYRAPGRPLHVRLRCYSADAATVLEVQDNGRGLDMLQQGKLFGMFVRPARPRARLGHRALHGEKDCRKCGRHHHGAQPTGGGHHLRRDAARLRPGRQR